jgi:prevent-host-death family protein
MPDVSEARKENEARTEVTADEAKRSFGELIARAGFGNERIAITRHGKKIAAIIGVRDLEVLDGAA